MHFGLVSALALVSLAVASGADSLRPTRWARFPTGVIQPRGWLKAQASLQAEALTSHLPLFWAEIANTSWLGGSADNIGGIHESTPYWLNGAVPLAYQLNHTLLLAVVDKYISGILDRQHPDGWLGPDTDPDDFWSRYPFVLALVQYHEAQPRVAPERTRVLKAALAFFAAVERRLAARRALQLWSAARVYDLIWALQYFAEAVPGGSASPRAAWLLALTRQLRNVGFDWQGAWFGNASAFPRVAADGDPDGMWTHGVNNAQAMKHGAVWSRQSDNASASVAESLQAWRVLMRYHGQPHGIFSADEHLAGRSPSRGTELCVVVEGMWSLALLAQASTDDDGATEALDALQGVAFNALPGGLSDDLWSRPYLQFPNSFQARPKEDDHVWASDGPDAAQYGLASQYECCTANFHQGIPKLTAHLFFEVSDENALVSAIWAPCELTTDLEKGVGGGASVQLRTEYPFGLHAEYIIRNPKAFELRIHVPKFLREVDGSSQDSTSLRVWVDGRSRNVNIVDGFVSYEIPAWTLPEPRVAVRLEWTSTPRIMRTDGHGASVFVGPLLLTPDLGETWQKVHSYEFGAADWDAVASQNWRYALVPPEASGGAHGFGPVVRRSPGARPFAHSSGACPLVVNATLLRLAPAVWPEAHSAPTAPPKLHDARGFFVEERLMLPYACSALHVAALPEAPPVEASIVL